VYWLQPPPYLRRAGAMLLIVGAIAWDLQAAATEPYPVAARPIAIGSPLTADAVAWIELPSDLIPTPDVSAATAARNIAAGEPLTSALLTGPVSAPPGWWTVPIEVGTLSAPGDEVMLVIVNPPLEASGLVITAQIGDPYTSDYRPAAVAVPPEAAPVIAAAEREGILITAVRAREGGL
jgi:Flp pilus assembly protein CpaB